MKLRSKVLVLLFLVGGATMGTLRAGDCQEQCNQSCYECGYNPLYCGAFDVQIQAGVVPIAWNGRETFADINCVGFAGPYVPLVKMPNFKKFFKLPWIVGGQVGYALFENSRIYIEFNYLHASRKNPTIVTTNFELAVPENLIFDTSQYQLFDAYVGARYYWHRWRERVAFFLGAQIGLARHKKVNFSLAITTSTAPTPVVVIPAQTPLFFSNTIVSGGANLGLDICFCGNWSLVITGEFLISCGSSSNPNIVLTPVSGTTATNALVGAICSELRFPVTAGIRYSF